MTHLCLSVSHFARLSGACVSPQFEVLSSLWGDFHTVFSFFPSLLLFSAIFKYLTLLETAFLWTLCGHKVTNGHIPGECMKVSRKQVIFVCLKIILHPLPEQIIRVFQRSVSREQAAPSVCHSSQSQHSGSPSSKTTLCLCAGVMKMGLTEQDVRRTCLSPWTSSRLSASDRLHCTGGVTHTFHIPVDVSRRPVGQLVQSHACFYKRKRKKAHFSALV